VAFGEVRRAHVPTFGRMTISARASWFWEIFEYMMTTDCMIVSIVVWGVALLSQAEMSTAMTRSARSS